MKKVNQNTIVNEIVVLAGVSKANAINIFNLISNSWTQDRIGLLSALEKGISVKTKRTTRRPIATVGKKVTKKTTPKTANKTVSKKTTPIATVGKKLKVKKGKKKLKKVNLPLIQTTTPKTKTA